MNDAIRDQLYYRVVEDIRERLARTHSLEKKLIRILRFFYGSINIVYTFEQQKKNIKQYVTPFGWVRYGLKILGRYDDDYWTHPFQHPRNWYRAFRGTGRASSEDFSNLDSYFDEKDASFDAMASIYKTGFRPARDHAYGPGVYRSPNPNYLHRGYTKAISVPTSDGMKNYKFMLQVSVNPDGVKFKSDDVWVVPKAEHIRPYVILIKVVTTETSNSSSSSCSLS
ncbi:hypothetical protein I4U23_011340 [Adineta vaga]|nr:hypothetical protein I4U23_011340 [Adineta vaga]